VGLAKMSTRGSMGVSSTSGATERAPSDRDLDGLTILVPPGARTGSLSSVAYYLLRDLIVTLELPPGELLNERDLMGRLDLGRTPIREALHHLERENLVQIYPRRGIVVAPVDLRDLGSISEVRVELEGLAARLAAERATTAERDVAAELSAELGATIGERDERTLIRFDQRVHRHVHRCAHNELLAATLDHYLVLSLRLWFLGLDRVRRLDEAVQEHREMLAAIREGDPDRAADAVRRHVSGFEREIRAVL
jgi:DNA-binding GntR family transcriptional regulator